MRRTGVHRGLAGLGATAFLVSPSFVLYEHYLFYPLPVAAAVTLSVLALARFLDRPTPTRAALFVFLLLVICAGQTVYQWPYALLIVAGVAAVYRDGRRGLLLGAVVPLMLLAALYVKNVAVFGLPSTGSWSGMSLAKMTVGYLDPHALESLIVTGAVSPISRIEPYSRFDAYPDAYFVADGVPDTPALTARLKSTGGDNLNHIGYLRLSRTYLRDSLVVLHRYPRTFLSACADAWWIYSWSSAAVRFLDGNKAHMDRWSLTFDRVVYGQLDDTGIYVTLSLALLLAVVFPVDRMLRGGLSPETTALFGCVLFNILYLAVVGNTLEMGENNRFRFTTDPLSAVMLVAALQWWLFRGRRMGPPRCPGT